MPTIGLLSLIDPVDPKNAAPAPKLKMPPSEAPSQYPAACTPRPTSRPVWVPLVALLEKTMDPWRAPSALGAKTRPTVQKLLGATLAPVQWSVPGARVKSLRAVPVMVKLLTVMLAVPPLTRATVWTVDVVPSGWLKKFDVGGTT